MLHTLAHLNQSIWLVSPCGSVFDLAIYVIQVCPPLYLPKTPLISLSGRIWKATLQCLWWGIHTLWAIERIIWGTYISLQKFSKPPERWFILGWMISNVYESNRSCNHPWLEMAKRPHLFQDNSRVDSMLIYSNYGGKLCYKLGTFEIWSTL